MLSKLPNSGYCVCIILLLYSSPCFPFATASHEIINDRAARGSQTFNPYLTDVLGFIAGLNTELRNNRGVNKPILGWIREGGTAEDELIFSGWFGEILGGLSRSTGHFHQPLRPWYEAGFLNGAFPSSARWAQHPSQFPGRKASWFDARSTYLDALKATTEQQRNAMFVETFQTLGQLMHLVADLGSVPHARDDAHPFAYNFEKFVAKRSDLIAGFIDFDKSILTQPTGDSFAIVPIARLWDTNTYNGTNPPGDLDQKIGLAEFTNANFFSRDTVRNTAFADPDFPLPAINRLVPGPRSKDPRTQEERQYLSKSGDGVSVQHMVLTGVFEEYSEYSGPSQVYYQLDDAVYEDYARHLLPRAIGYSAGILDYFFRGKIKIEAPDRFVYALASYAAGNTGSFTKMRFKVSNATDYPSTTEDTNGPGQMWAVVRYRKPLSGNLFEDPFANLSDPFYAVSAPQTVSLTRAAQEITFDFTGNKIPTNAADIFLMVVWQGKLGLEDGAVMVGAKDLFEPDPLDFGNGTDYDCFQQTLYHVADLNAFPNYNPPSQTQRDVSNPKDRIQDVFGPFIENDQFIKTYDPSKPQTATPTLFDFNVSQHQATVAGPQYSRFVLLQDQPLYAFSWRVGSSVEVPSGNTDTNPRFYNFSVDGIRNDFVTDPVTGSRTRRVTSNFQYRGLPTFYIFLFVVGGPPKFDPCVSASFLLPEPFTRIEGQLAPE